MSWYHSDHPKYETLAERQAKAAKAAKKLAAEHGSLNPAVAKGTKIAATFWGQAWNRNLERYQHYASRLPRGRSYVRNGLVLDLKVEQGRIKALVSGSSVYEVTINIKPLDTERWAHLKQQCAGQISSLVGLLQGKLPPSVMEAVTKEETGLFPEPKDIQFICTCPDYADLCKHSAAAAYGVGARLDERPELLFLLRGVDHTELIAGAGSAVAAQGGPETSELDDLSAIFGIEIESAPAAAPVGEEHAKPSKKKDFEERKGGHSRGARIRVKAAKAGATATVQRKAGMKTTIKSRAGAAKKKSKA